MHLFIPDPKYICLDSVNRADITTVTTVGTVNLSGSGFQLAKRAAFITVIAGFGLKISKECNSFEYL